MQKADGSKLDCL